MAQKSNHKILTGEASIHYIFYPTVPRRMKEDLPDVKLIVILRNPVDRAYSHYHMILRIYHDAFSFEKAIESEPVRRAKGWESMIESGKFVLTDYHKYSYLGRVLRGSAGKLVQLFRQGKVFDFDHRRLSRKLATNP